MSRTKKPKGSRCVWNRNFDGYYETDCGEAFICNEGTVEQNGIKQLAGEQEPR